MKRAGRYTITDIAKELGVTRQTIYYWIKKNWVMPKRDYRNYPVFTNKDLSSIKKWYNALTKTEAVVKEKPTKKLPTAPAVPTAPAWKWQEVQKMLWK